MRAYLALLASLWALVRCAEDLVVPNPKSATSEDVFDALEKFKTLEADKDGFYSHAIDMQYGAGHKIKMNYRGRFMPKTFFHNMEDDSELKNIYCDDKIVKLFYDTPTVAQKMQAAFASALGGGGENENALLTGRQLWKCPAVEPPEEMMKTEEGERMEKRFRQGVRRVTSAKIAPAAPHVVLLVTSYASLSDVFYDLEFSGEADIPVEPKTPFNFNHKENLEIQVDKDEEEEQARLRKAIIKEDGTIEVKPEFFKKIFRAVKKVVKKVVKHVVKKVKQVVNVVKTAAVTTFNACKKGVGKCVLGVLKTAATFLPRVIGVFIPPLVDKRGSAGIRGQFTINYGGPGRALNQLAFDSNGVYTGPFIDFGKANKQNNKKQISLLIMGKVNCINCYIRFFNGRISWRVKVGGGTTAEIQLTGKFDYELMLEVIATISMIAQVTIPGPEIPIPKLSIPLKVITLGFKLAPEISFGVQLTINDLYYKYHAHGWQEAGMGIAFLGKPYFIKRGGRYRKPVSIGPVIKGGVSVSVYALPLCGLVFTDVCAVEAGIQPTITFTLERSQGACALKWGIGFDMPLVIGAWVGMKTHFGMWRLAGWSMAFKIIPFPANLISGCVTKRTIDSTAKFGVPRPPVINGKARVGKHKGPYLVMNNQGRPTRTYTNPATAPRYANTRGWQKVFWCSRNRGRYYQRWFWNPNTLKERARSNWYKIQFVNPQNRRVWARSTQGNKQWSTNLGNGRALSYVPNRVNNYGWVRNNVLASTNGLLQHFAYTCNNNALPWFPSNIYWACGNGRNGFHLIPRDGWCTWAWPQRYRNQQIEMWVKRISVRPQGRPRPSLRGWQKVYECSGSQKYWRQRWFVSPGSLINNAKRVRYAFMFTDNRNSRRWVMSGSRNTLWWNNLRYGRALSWNGNRGLSRGWVNGMVVASTPPLKEHFAYSCSNNRNWRFGSNIYWACGNGQNGFHVIPAWKWCKWSWSQPNGGDQPVIMYVKVIGRVNPPRGRRSSS